MKQLVGVLVLLVFLGGGTTKAENSPFIASASRSRAADRELRASFVYLSRDWRFRTDPNDEGRRAHWETASIDSSEWRTLQPRMVWEKQGFAGYDGIAWYEKDVAIPANWAGHDVDLISNGVDDEFDLYVNGKLVGHRGDGEQREFGSISRWRTVTPIASALRAGKVNRIALRVNDWQGDGGLWGDIFLRRRLPFENYKKFLPEPVVSSKPEWVRLYWKAWEIAWRNVAAGTPENHFAPLYMDEAFNEDVYQWDSVFMTMFGRYGNRLFPSIDTLDNFYQGQRADGYIQRIYLEDNGKIVYEPTADDPNVNPPLFAWAEIANYRATGNLERLKRVYPVLSRYYQWLDANTRSPMDNGLYFQTDFGSGMDNVPRADLKKGTWTDMSLQMALFAKQMGEMASIVGRDGEVKRWQDEHQRLKQIIDRVAWNDEDGYYYDVQPDAMQTRVRHIGAFWALISGVADEDHTKRLVSHLEDPKEFNRPHLFPSLAASDSHYDPKGNYWVGSVWASTNYMAIKGLEQRGYFALARKAAENDIENMAAVLTSNIDESLITPAERDGDYQSIWECYAPESAAPGTTWDAKHLSRHHFVGWSGAAPIALLIENVLGFDVSVPERTVKWNLTRTDEHGIRNMSLGGDDVFSLVAEQRQRDSKSIVIRSASTRDFKLILTVDDRPARELTIKRGQQKLQLKLSD